MKKILFTVLLCSMLCVLSAQSRKQVRQYYYWVNQAELAICDSNYQRASECYHTAFAIKRPCIRDAAFAYKLHTEYLYNLDRACEAFHFLALSGDKAYFSDGDPYVDDTVTYAELWQHINTILELIKVEGENGENLLRDYPHCPELEKDRAAPYSLW